MSEQNLSCPVCSFPRVRSRPFGYLFNGKRLEAQECRRCRIIFIHPQPTSEELRLMYSKEYFEGDFRCGHEGSYFDDSTLERLIDPTLLDRMKQYRREGNFLEIGCAGGAFLDAARSAGYRAQGVEFSPDAAQFARVKFGLDVFAGDIMEARFPSGNFDVVFMGDVLEHLPDPAVTLKEVNRIMQPGGLLVVECPMQTNTLFSRLGFAFYGLLKRSATVQLPPYHLFEYRPGSMRNLFSQCGFRVVRKSESMIPPSEIAMRGSFLQNMGKKMFQYLNYPLVKMLRMFGDRIEMFAVKDEGLPK